MLEQRTTVDPISTVQANSLMGNNKRKSDLSFQFDLQAIRDGVIEAVLDHDHGRMQSKENTDIYCTREPQLAFHQRIQVLNLTSASYWMSLFRDLQCFHGQSNQIVLRKI